MADYIPALASVPPHQFGIAIHTLDGREHACGDADTPFSIQSISKAFMLALTLQADGEQLWRHVGKEPSGNPFNSLVQLEYEHGIPRNPFITPAPWSSPTARSAISAMPTPGCWPGCAKRPATPA